MSGDDWTYADTVGSLAPIGTMYTDYGSVLAGYLSALASASEPVRLANGRLAQAVPGQEPMLYDKFLADTVGPGEDIVACSDMLPPVVALTSKELKVSIQRIRLSLTIGYDILL